MKKNLFVLLGLLVASLVFTSCGGSKEEGAAKEGALNVVCTIGMIGNVVSELAGENATVKTLIPVGADPHVYQHGASDVKHLEGADVIFYNGLHLEGKMGEVLKKMKEKGKAVYAVGELALEKASVQFNEEEGEDDPHAWMDAELWTDVASFISKTLGEVDAENASTYEENFAQYKEELAKLDAYAEKTLATIPEGQRYLVTAHDAFGYMESAYGVKVRGIQGISTESEAGLKDLEELITFLIEKKVPAVFVESSVNDKNVRALMEGAKAKGHEVTIGGELFSDAMGLAGTYEGTYVGMIDHNVTTITRALGGNAPEGGMQGKLGKGE